MPLNNANLPEKSREELVLELEEYKRRLTAILSSARLASVVLAKDTHIILFANKYFCELVGYEPREVIGRDFIETFVPAEMKSQHRNIINMVLTGFVEFLQYVESEVITKVNQC